MKKILFVVIVILFLFGLVKIGNKFRSLYQENKQVLDPVVNLHYSQDLPKNTIELPYQDKILQISWVKVDKPESIILYSNLREGETAQHLKDSKNCKTLVNAGFYSKSDKPIGMLISEGTVITPTSKNVLFNGFFGISRDNQPIISSKIEEKDIQNGIQAGPLLKVNKELQTLNLQTDSLDRRTVVGLTSNNEIIFLTIFQKDSAFLGPLLTDLPTILNKFESMTGIILVNALNLDGGTASAFLTDSVSVNELTKIGSYFCIRD